MPFRELPVAARQQVIDFAYHSGAFPRKLLKYERNGSPVTDKGLMEPAEECIAIYT